MVAALGGHVEIMRMLLARAPNTAVDDVDAMGFTALLMAAQYHHAAILRLLADHGANVGFACRAGGRHLCASPSGRSTPTILPDTPTPTARGSSPP